jgi:hypothetical protein
MHGRGRLKSFPHAMYIKVREEWSRCEEECEYILGVKNLSETARRLGQVGWGQLFYFLFYFLKQVLMHACAIKLS